MYLPFTPVHCPHNQWGLDTVNSHFCCVELQIILINCQCLISAGWHRLKISPQGMLDVYIQAFLLGKKSPRLKMCQWKCLRATVFPFLSGCVSTEHSGREMSGLHSRLCGGMKICQIAGLQTIMYNMYHIQCFECSPQHAGVALQFLCEMLPARR